MDKWPFELEQDPRGVILPVWAHAGARRNGIPGVRNGAIRVAVTTAPEKGKANRAIIAVLSNAFDVPKSTIELISGQTSTRKRFLVMGTTTNQLRSALERILGQD